MEDENNGFLMLGSQINPMSEDFPGNRRLIFTAVFFIIPDLTNLKTKDQLK